MASLSTLHPRGCPRSRLLSAQTLKSGLAPGSLYLSFVPLRGSLRPLGGLLCHLNFFYRWDLLEYVHSKLGCFQQFTLPIQHAFICTIFIGAPLVLINVLFCFSLGETQARERFSILKKKEPKSDRQVFTSGFQRNLEFGIQGSHRQRLGMIPQNRHYYSHLFPCMVDG